MLPNRILLVDKFAPLIEAWSQTFEPYEHVEVVQGDFFTRDSDAMVSPANSFGIMDGGLDAAINFELGGGMQSRVQEVILQRYHGEMPVGAGEVVPTGHKRWPFLVVSPTMRVPESVANTLNAYHAFRAVLLAVMKHNATASAPISSLLVPGLGTGVGGMEPRRCAAQMRMAYDQVSKPPRIPSYQLIHQLHHKLRSAG